MNVGQQKLGVTKSMTTDQPVLITTEEHLLSAFVHVFHICSVPPGCQALLWDIHW